MNSIKYNDLPRKVKKGLKTILRKSIDKRWNDRNIKIRFAAITHRNKHKQYRGYRITSYNLT